MATIASCGVFAADKTQSSTPKFHSPATVAQAIASTHFVAVEHPTVGQVSIIEADGKKYLKS